MGYPFQYSWASLVAQLVKNLCAVWETVGDLGLIPALGRSLVKGMATHSSILIWRIPWTVPHGVAKRQTKLSDFQFSLRKRRHMV